MGEGELPYGTLVADLILKDFLRRMGKKWGRSHRFNNQSQVLKLAGTDLSAERSGKTSNRAVPVISKKGKADLRYALYQAALIASTKVSR